jgi:uncharacterized Zn finger protein (UPF0148 family)
VSDGFNTCPVSGSDLMSIEHSHSSPGVTAAPQPKAPETLTKRQRQHTAKREADKALKADSEIARQARLAKYRRDQERERMAEQQSRKDPGST